MELSESANGMQLLYNNVHVAPLFLSSSPLLPSSPAVSAAAAAASDAVF